MPNFNIDIKGPIDSIEASLLRGAVSVFFVLVIYVTFS